MVLTASKMIIAQVRRDAVVLLSLQTLLLKKEKELAALRAAESNSKNGGWQSQILIDIELQFFDLFHFVLFVFCASCHLKSSKN